MEQYSSGLRDQPRKLTGRVIHGARVQIPPAPFLKGKVMAEKTIKAPKQKRAIETRNKIIESGFLIFAKKGFYHTTVDEIANSAGLSTGIAYRYFKNKRDILLAVLEYAYEHVKSFSRAELSGILSQEDLTKAVGELLDILEHTHRKYYALHEELEGMRHSDDEVRVCYDQIERRLIGRIRRNLPKEYQKKDNIEESLTLSYLLMENYCHMAVSTKYLLLDLDFVRHATIQSIVEMMSK